MDSSPIETLAPSSSGMDIETATVFLQALFEEQDRILFRPIETWNDAGTKRSKVDYKNTTHRNATPQSLYFTLRHQLTVAERTRANLFFGVCPRFGDKGRFDLGWQIRTVRALWADVDHVTVDEVRERLATSGLPDPSILVNSGHGAHLYWKLAEPYLIDDADDPPAVETEWIEGPDGRRKPRRYVLDGDDRIALDQRKSASRLSPKALHVQNVLAGIADACGGDHTTDLARLLRLPGTLNRKDERNGRTPVRTALIECDPSRRYPLAAFESLATVAPEGKRAREIAAMPLPGVRKTTASKSDKLAQLIAASGIAAPGQRSEADFAVCCYAIRSGIASDDVWAQVESVGKFAEQGRQYFERTWENAEYEVRAGLHANIERSMARRLPDQPPVHSTGAAVAASEPTPGPTHSWDGPPDDGGDEGEPERPTIRVNADVTPVHVTMHRISNRLLAAGDCYVRSDQLVVLSHGAISPILSSAELAGLLNQHVEFYFVDEKGGEYRPLPATYGNTWLHHPGERARLPVIRTYSHNPTYTEDWRLAAPGYDAASGIFYEGPVIERREGTERLDALLQDFCFQAAADRTNYLGMLLTILLMPRFIGSKPAVLFNGNQPELGKSILAQIIAILRDGRPVETASYNANDEEFEKRLGAIVRRGATTIIIDNAKARGRHPRIESACLERSITDPILSFRMLGYSQDIRAENSHIFCITANSPDVSRDLVTRSVVVNLHFEGNPERRRFTIPDPEGYAREHRLELLGELIGMVERWKDAGMPQADVHSRFNKRGWGNVIGGILQANGEPDFLSNAEQAATQLDETRREFEELIAILAEHPQGTWTPAELVAVCQRHNLLQAELGNGSLRSQTTHMGNVAGRYVAEPFPLPNQGSAVFHRSEGRKGKLYRVEVVAEGSKVPNLRAFAEPLPNLCDPLGSAP